MALPKIICLSGYSKSGKDLCFSLLDELYPDTFIRMALADKLKKKLKKFIKAEFGINILKPKQEQKELIRPLLIAMGQCKRQQDPLYWVKKLIAEINRLQLNHVDKTIVITDCRFENEARTFADIYGPEEFKLVEITRGDLTPNIKEELENQPRLSAMADYRLNWPFVGEGNFSQLIPYVKDLYTLLNKEVDAEEAKIIENNISIG